MTTSCIIRFTDADGETCAHVYRKRHGHLEDMITNLSALKISVDRQRGHLPPGVIAAQFLFLDILWYALRKVPLGDLEEELHTILYSPAEVDEREYRFLQQHRVIDGNSPTGEMVYVYEAEVDSEEEWQIKIAENPTVEPGPVNGIFETVGWAFSGDLTEAVRQIE